MSNKKDPISLDPFDVASEILTGDIFSIKNFTGIETASEVKPKESKEDNGNERSDDNGKRGAGNDVRNPFKPSAKREEKAGSAKEGRATSGDGSGQQEQSESDKSKDGKSE